jgi:hypothetical protein
MTTAENKTCAQCKSSFLIEAEDFLFYERIKVPPPTWCPRCRMQRRMIFRNERLLFRRTCGLCHKDIITMYHPAADVVVYCNECWWSDKWDAAQYGIDYDFSVPFFDQFARLLKEVPRMALEAFQNEYSPYTNYTWLSKNIYLSPSTMYSENISYSHGITRCQDSVDCTYIYNSQLCYECSDCQNCSSSIHLTDCKDCIDSAFLYDCRGCTDCFMGSGLRNKSFVFRGEQLKKDEYRNRLRELGLGNYSMFTACIREYEKLRQQSIHRFADLFNTTHSTGNNLIDAKNARQCFTGEKLENVSYGIRAFEIKDSADFYGVGNGAELLYDGVNVGYKDSLIRFSTNTFEEIRDATYCDYCRTSQNIFGCVGLRKKQYHILNKAYAKDEYESLVKKIIAHMDEMSYVDSLGRVYGFGEFFPPELSPFPYNGSVADEYYPMGEQEIVKNGFPWRAPETRDYRSSKTPSDLPDDIHEIPDSIVQETIGCLHAGSCGDPCTIAFKILESELQFYRRMNVPLPRLCPNCRHYGRARYRNPLNVQLWRRACMCDQMGHEHSAVPCHNEFETPYAPGRPEVVYCEQCYQKEIS